MLGLEITLLLLEETNEIRAVVATETQPRVRFCEFAEPSCSNHAGSHWRELGKWGYSLARGPSPGAPWAAVWAPTQIEKTLGLLQAHTSASVSLSGEWAGNKAATSFTGLWEIER